MSRSVRKSVVLACAAMLLLAGCGGGDKAATTTTSAPPPKLRVVATTPEIADFVSVIAGDYTEIYTMLKPNIDPHDYEATPADITALSRADIIFRNGAGLEPWFDTTMKGVERKGSVENTSVGVTFRYSDTARREVDPHIWHSPSNAKIMVANITRALAARDTVNASTYQGNERAYDAQLDGLRRDISQSISSLANKKLVTSHDSLGYYADEFGLEQVGSVVPSFNSQAELSSAQITSLVAKIKAQQVKAVFVESSLPPKTAETVAQEAGVKIVGGEDAIYGDSMGPPGSDADTYLKMERHNTNVIVDALR